MQWISLGGILLGGFIIPLGVWQVKMRIEKFSECIEMKFS